MSGAVERLAVLWTAMIVAYGVIAVTLIIVRWTLNRLGQALNRERTLPYPAQNEPH
jgi:hypothetical protein